MGSGDNMGPRGSIAADAWPRRVVSVVTCDICGRDGCNWGCATDHPERVFGLTGWRCPICGSVWSPAVEQCKAEHPQQLEVMQK